MKSENNTARAVIYVVRKNDSGKKNTQVIREYPTLLGAKIAKTRVWDKKAKARGEKYFIATLNDYVNNIKTVSYSKRPNVITGKMMEIADGTPSYCDPTSEAYWSM